MKPPATLNQLFLGGVERFSTKRAALRYRAGGEWHDITHRELERRVHHVGLGLRKLGVQPGDRVAIVSANRPEWAVADLACLMIGCTDVAVYPTLLPHQMQYILDDSASCAVFVEDRKQYDKILQIRDQLPHLEHIIGFDDLGPDAGAVALARLMQLGASVEVDYPSYHTDAMAVPEDALATLVYTSGTTGEPKGVMLTHGNLTSNAVAALALLPVGPNDVCLSLLPLSHSFERTPGYYSMFHAGVTICYASSWDAVASNMMEIRPTVMIAVPRFYEKLHARVLENALSGGTIKKRLFHWARRIGEEWADLTLAKQSIPARLALQYRVAHRLIFSKLQKRTGGRLRYFVSGGAPLMPETAKFLFAAGLPVIEGYGLTETSPVISVNPLESPRLGTVGVALPEVEVRIAGDGEILARGPNVMRGYYNRPDETAKAIDEEGWFHTGDIGELDEDGYLRVTDRKKDIIVTAGGKNIAPQPIENRVKASRFVSNAVMIGDKRKFPMILVVPDAEALRKWARERQLTAGSPSDLLKLPDVSAKVEREVMLTLRDLAGYQMPKKVLLLEDDFTIENGMLTPSLKAKRHVIEERYKDRIDACYT